MRNLMIRVAIVTITVVSASWLAFGTATAVTPQQCEQEGSGHVDFTLEPDGVRAICTCSGGFYRDLEVFGAHSALVGTTIIAMQCVGLGTSA